MMDFHDDILQLSERNFYEQKRVVAELLSYIDFTEQEESLILNAAVDLSQKIRIGKKTFIEELLSSYDLSHDEGAALLSLTEALLRIKDQDTINLLLEDKLKDKNWIQSLERSSFFMKFTALGLFTASKAVNFTGANFLSKCLSKVSAPVIHAFIKKAIKHTSHSFIIGENIEEAMKNALSFQKKEYLFSYDILGESSRNMQQAEYYYNQYIKTIEKMSSGEKRDVTIFSQNNLSVKISALHPRFELLKLNRLEAELLPKLKTLIKMCMKRSICIIFDAEESFRADAYIAILAKVMADPEFHNFNGIGVVVQAYQKRTFELIDLLKKMALQYRRQIPVRLVKGAYWDSEVKRSQMLGLKNYPVFTRKKYTDLSYLACAKKLLENLDCFYPQFATHNAQTVAAVLHMAHGKKGFEFQKLLGMGDALYDTMSHNISVRIYAPLGKYEDLLAYLMRRFIENGANTSFVHNVLKEVDLKDLNTSPIEECKRNSEDSTHDMYLPLPRSIYKGRENSQGFELGYVSEVTHLEAKLAEQSSKLYDGYSIINGKAVRREHVAEIESPLNQNRVVGKSYKLDISDLDSTLKIAHDGFEKWSATSPAKRREILLTIADLYEEHKYEFYHLLINEAGKSIEDAISEVREAIDFIRYYVQEADKLFNITKRQSGYTGELNILSYHPKGVFLCISPWNFPLAIFTGQVIAALATGNSVITKPAATTTAVATMAVEIMLKAKLPKKAIQLVIAGGRDISEVIIKSDLISGVCFTGSTEVAQQINRTLADRKAAIATFIAETGGQNCMLVDSSALLEQVTDDVIRSAFNSQGQRCSALRVLYIQDEIYEPLLNMLIGALDQLEIGDTNKFHNDLGAVIDEDSVDNLLHHVTNFKSKVKARHISHLESKDTATYFKPTIIEIDHIRELKQEVFGAILHVRRFSMKNLSAVIAEINSTGYGLTFGIHSRIRNRYQMVANMIRAGNIYINRNMIGAVVESQPFGGENLSGTGFKAGGPNYLLRFVNERTISENTTALGGNLDLINCL